jgi:6,7-dimethyl-8-ribityllumazine synthase
MRVAIVIGEFHKEIADAMLEEAKKKIQELNCELKELVWVPGSYEAPLVVKSLLERSDIDVVAVLGYIEKGETLHGEHMGIVTSRIFKELELKYGKPVGMGIIGPGATQEQAMKRISYGAKAVQAAVRLASLLKTI